jgi:hypothetical protein
MIAFAVLLPGPVLEKPPRVRRWVPLTLRMFVAILGLLGSASAIVVGMPVYRQHMGIAAVERVEGAFSTRFGGPSRLRRWIGDEWMKPLDHVIDVNLRGTATTDTDLAQIASIPTLRSLWLDRTLVTDAGLAHISGLTELGDLSLNDLHVTDAGLVHIRRLRRLGKLSLDRTQVSDEGLRFLKSLPNLHMLRIRGTKVTNAGVAELQRALPEIVVEK